jgi:sugar phosphate isomerase/epimerase
LYGTGRLMENCRGFAYDHRQPAPPAEEPTMSRYLTRRQWLTRTPAVLAAASAGTATAADRPADEPFGYCLNSSTIREQPLPLVQKYEIAARAGYTAIEPWIRDLDRYVQEGGSLQDLGKRIRDLGLAVPSAIGFCEWIVDDDAQRARGLEEARRSMEVVRQIGGERIAAPPVGATKQADLDLRKAAERYHALLEVGRQQGVVPQVELWGFSLALSRIGEVAYVATEAGHPQATLLLDVYHIHKGGSDFGALRLLNGAAMHCFHVNDYPADPPRATITDAHRVYPGDGVAPLRAIFRTLHQTGFRGYLSLELFNKDYWQQDALHVARTGLEKTRAAVRAAFAAG